MRVFIYKSRTVKITTKFQTKKYSIFTHSCFDNFYVLKHVMLCMQGKKIKKNNAHSI